MTALADARQREEALDLSQHILAVAPAGAGKTGLLVQRFLAALATVDEPEQVVAITFTRKAAAEIRARAIGLIETAAHSSHTEAPPHLARSLELAAAAKARSDARGWDLVANPDRLRALTIDSLQAQIAAELPLLSGLGARPGIVDDAYPLYEAAVFAMFADVQEPDVEDPLRQAGARWLRWAGNRVDRLIDPLAGLLAQREQWQGALDPDIDWAGLDAQALQALHIEAQQAFYEALGDADAEELLSLAREAAPSQELLSWAEGLNDWPELGSESTPLCCELANLLVTKDGSLRKIVNIKLGFAPKTPEKSRLTGLLAARSGDTALEVAAHDIRQLPPARMPAELAELRASLLLLLRRLLGHLRRIMGERGETDYAQISLAALNALRPDGGYGEALLRRDAQIRHLLVDEMQDTSESQIRLLEQLTLGWQDGDGRSLFLVGDPQQSIYAFRKAEVRLFQHLWSEQKLGELQLQCLRLSTNFRSAPGIVDWFNTSFPKIFPRQDKELAGEVAYSPSVAGRSDLTAAAKPVAHHLAGKDYEGEAAAAADRAGSLIGGSSVAILVRARPHLAAVLTALRARGIAAACQDVDPLAGLPAVRDLVACARALWHPQDRLSWAVLLRAPFVGLCWEDLLALSAGRTALSWPERIAQADIASLTADGQARLARLREALAAIDVDLERRADLSWATESLWTRLGGAAGLRPGGLADVRQALLLLRKTVAEDAFVDSRGFERALAALYAAPAEGAVQVMTIHKAKGLEFDHVLLVGCGRRPKSEDRPLLHWLETPHGRLLVPKPAPHWPEDQAAPSKSLYDYLQKLHSRARRNETLRLLYVAATRARLSLDFYLCGDLDKNGELQYPADSFGDRLLPCLDAAPTFEVPKPIPLPAAQTPANGAYPPPPRAARLRLPFTPPVESGLFRPREQRALRPSEAVLSAADDKRLDEDDVYAQLVGTLFHQALEKIAHDGLAAWADGGESRRSSLASGFRRLGMPEPEVGRAVDRVVSLVKSTLDSEQGRWLLGPHPWARSEYALAGWRDGRWVAASLDRCFETEDGELWVVDYKTSAEPLEAGSVENYIAAALERYRPQLALYSSLLAEQRAKPRIRSALFFPEPGRLIELRL